MSAFEPVVEKLVSIDFPRPCLARVFPEADAKLQADGSLVRSEVERAQLALMFRDLQRYSFDDPRVLFSKRWKTMNRFTQVAKPRSLGLIGIAEAHFDFSNLNWYYCYVAKAKARRHDQKESVYQIWQRERVDILSRACLSFAHYNPQLDLLEQPLTTIEDECFFRLRELGGPGLFPSLLAVGFFKKYGATKVLDLAAGWGCRLTAACATDIEYVGADPNTELIPVHQEIIHHWGDAKKHRVLAQPFEDIQWSNEDWGTFDMLFTSPPFFNLEIYSNESTQCSQRYPTHSEWLDQFLFPSLKTADRLLKANATIVIHLNDVIMFGRPWENVAVCEHMIQYVTRTLKWKVLGQYGFANRRLINISRHSEEQPDYAVAKDKSAFRDKRRKVCAKLYDGDGFRVDQQGVVLAQPLFVFQK